MQPGGYAAEEGDVEEEEREDDGGNEGVEEEEEGVSAGTHPPRCERSSLNSQGSLHSRHEGGWGGVRREARMEHRRGRRCERGMKQGSGS